MTISVTVPTINRVNVPVVLVATVDPPTPYIVWECTDHKINIRVAFNGQEARFTPSVEGLYQFNVRAGAESKNIDVIVGTPTPVCKDPNSHWDAALQNCVCNRGYHDENGICVRDPITGAKYDSNIQGLWANGVHRIVTDREGNVGPDGFGFTVNASGGGGFDIDGNGTGVLAPTGSGHRRIYVACTNYDSILKGKFNFLNDSPRNASIKIRNRHQYGDEVDSNAPASKRQGGVGIAFSKETQEIEFQWEVVHGTNGGSDSAKLPFNIEVGQWYDWEYLLQDVTSSTTKVQVKLNNTIVFDKVKSLPSVFYNKADFIEWSQFWLRLNDAGKIGWKDIQLFPL